MLAMSLVIPGLRRREWQGRQRGRADVSVAQDRLRRVGERDCYVMPARLSNGPFPSWDDYRFFLATSEAGSFTKAAKD